jgi:hypothetical protein
VIRFGQQECEQAALFRAAERKLLSVDLDFERAEDPKLHVGHLRSLIASSANLRPSTTVSVVKGRRLASGRF